MSLEFDTASARNARSAGWVPETVFGLGVVALVAALVIQVATGVGDSFLAASQIVGMVCAVVVRRRRPTLFASAFFLLSCGLDGAGVLTAAVLAYLDGNSRS